MTVLFFALGVALGILISEWARGEERKNKRAKERTSGGRWPGVLIVNGQPTIRYQITPQATWPKELRN